MKKSLIAGTGAAAFAFAALPFAGVFAVDGPVDVVDNVTVRIAESCTFQATQGTDPNEEVVAPTDGTITRSFAKDVELGQAVILGDASAEGGSGKPSGEEDIVIEGVCNTGDSSTPATSGTWAITAAGNDTTAKLNGPAGTTAIESTAAKANLTEGTVSGWGMKIANNPATGYNDWNVVPGIGGGVVANGTAAGESFAFTPSYRVYVGTEQEAGTYTGTVTYTIAYTAP